VIALIELYKQTSNWQKLLDILNTSRKNKITHKGDHEVEKAIAHYQLSLTEPNSKIAEKHIIAAQKLLPNNPAIQISYAKYLLSKKKKATLTKYIKAIWPSCQLAELIDIYLENMQGKKLQQKFKALEKLMEINPRGEAVILRYADLAYQHSKNYVKTKELLKKYLNTTNSENIYDMAVKFFSEFQENITDEEFYDDLLKQSKNYHNKTGYFCTSCKTAFDEWQATCSNCQSFDSIKYDFIKPIALISLNQN